MGFFSKEDLILLAFEVIFLLLMYQAILLHDTTRLYVVFVAMVLTVVPLFVEKGMGISLPAGVKSMIAFTLFLHVAGGVLRWYWIYKPWYDKFAHFIAGATIGLLGFVFFIFLDRWGFPAQRKRVIAGIFLIVLFLGLFWEIAEIFIDTLGYSTYSNGILDNIQDMVSNTLGSIVAILVAYYAMKRLPPGAHLSELVRKKGAGKKDL
jgi:VanZ family protein